MKYIIIGFGGTGSETVNGLIKKLPEQQRRNFAAFAIDTEKAKLVDMDYIPEQNKIQISTDKLVKDIVSDHPEKKFDYLSKDRNLVNTQLNTGAGQVRQLSRLGYETITDDLPNLIYGINNLLLEAQNNNNEEVKIYFIGSVCGGTGSGCMLQVSYFIQNYLFMNHGQLAIEPTAFLYLPGVFTSVQDVDLSHNAKKRLNANAYAFFKEWNTYNEVMQNGGKQPKEPELLELFIGQTGGGQIQITKQDIQNNTKYLQEPFKHFVCIDAAPGRHYQYLSDYKNLIIDYLYAMTVSLKAGDASGRLVNGLELLMQQNGIARFNSLNAAKIIYDKDKIEELASLVIFERTFSEDYTRLDIEYNQEVDQLQKERKRGDYSGEIPTRADFFMRQFMNYANSIPKKFGGFYTNSLVQLKMQFDRERGETEIDDVFKYDYCFEKMLEYILDQTNNLRNLAGAPTISSFQSTIDDQLQSFEESQDKQSVVYSIETEINEFEIQMERIERTNILNIASGIFNFKEKSEEDAIDTARNSLYNPLSYILGTTIQSNQANFDFFNPVSARFFLYKLNNLIDEKKKELREETMNNDGNRIYRGIIPSIEAELIEIREDDYLSRTTDIEDPREAINLGVERDEKWGVFKNFIGNNVKDFWSIYKPNIEREKDLLVQLFQHTVTYKVLDIISEKIEQFAILWENYFVNINTASTERHVAERIKYLSSVDNNGNTFEIFKDSVEKFEFIQKKFAQHGTIHKVNQKVVRKLVDETIDKIHELHQSNSSLDVGRINIGLEQITTTLQSDLAEDGLFNQPLMVTWRDFLNLLNYDSNAQIKRITNDINKLKTVGTPLIHPVQNAQNNVTYPFWMLHDDNEQFLANNYPQVAPLLGVKVDDNTNFTQAQWSGQYLRASSDGINPYHLTLTSLNTGYSYKNIQAFKGPVNPTFESIFSAAPNAGLYFKSYFAKRMDEWKTNSPSVHIDERWSGVGILKDLNDNVDDLFKDEINKAFVRGLVLEFFVSDKNNQLENTWKINTTKFPNAEYIGDGFIKNIDGKAIRYGFYDLYYALYNNLNFVLQLNGYIDSFGVNHSGVFDNYFEQDEREYRNWRDHRFIKGTLAPIYFARHANIQYNILDAVTHLHKDGKNNVETYQLEEDLLRTLFEELISYHKKVYGQGDVYQQRLKNLIEDICATSRLAQNKNLFDIKLRKRYFEVVNSFYEGPNLEKYIKI